LKKKIDLQSILKECQKLRTPVYIASSGLDIAFQTIIHEIDSNSVVLENMVRPEFIERFAKGTTYFLQCKMVRLQSTSLTPRGTFMVFKIEDNSLTEETRQAERFMFAPEEKVIADILNPFDHSTILQRHVIDMSATGLSIRINSSTTPFKPGVRLPDIKVHIDGKLWTSCQADVVYNRKFMDLGGHLRIQVGMKIVAAP
jgi:hypothetical protein